jgi:hypothetical protein
MKRQLNLLNSIVLVTLLLPAFSFAGKTEDVEKKKTISKSYTVTANDKLDIDNQFGDVVINTWDKSEIKVDIEITAEASSEERAQSLLNNIEVADSRSDNTISFKTTTDNKNNNGDSWSKNKKEGNNRKFEINYVVYMPAGNPLKILNQFGKTTVPDFTGVANITSKFGSLKAGKLTNVEEIDVEFGTAEIGEVRNGKVSLKFDDQSSIGQINGTVKLNVEFSGNSKFSIDNNIDELSVNESYSDIKFIVTKDLSASFNIHTNFGDFHNKTDFKISEDKEENDEDNSGPKFDKDYAGKSGDGKAKIKIKSSFGSIRLSHSSAKDSDEEQEEREERKEKKEHKEKKEKKEKDEVNI